MMPAEAHKNLEKYAGKFDVEISMVMNDGAAPVVIMVKSTNKMILGGRFLEMTQMGDMMGMSYQAISTMGFNNTDKNFNLTTITNMGTGTLYVTGPHDPLTNTAELRGILSNPVNEQMIEVRQVFHFLNEDQMMIENFDKEEGSEERKTIEYKFTRIKK